MRFFSFFPESFSSTLKANLALLYYLAILSSLLVSYLLFQGNAGEVAVVVNRGDQDDGNLPSDLLDKLTSKEVKVFAAGHVSGQMTLFISGSSSKTDFAGGYQVTVKDDPADGRFSVDSALKLVPKYNSITGTEVMFVCQDSDGSSSLVTMSQDKVGALNLGQNKFTKLNINSDSSYNCFAHGRLHFSTTEAKTFYVVDQSNGETHKFAFNGENINSALSCNEATKKALGNLCKIGEDKITLSSSCSGSPPANIISGFVSSGTAYLFDGDNTVYYFDASVFTGEKTVDLKKVDKKDAWQSSGQAGSSQKPPPKPPTEGTGSNPALIAIIVILGLLLLLIAIGVTLYCCFLSPETDAKKKTKMMTTNSKGKAGKGKGKESKTKSKAPFSPSSAKGSKRKSSRSPDSKKKSSSKQK